MNALPGLNQLYCEVCESSISYPDFLKSQHLDYTVCQSFDCRRTMGQKSKMSSVFFKAHLKFCKQLIKQRIETDRLRKAHIEDVVNKEALENSSIYNNVLKMSCELSSLNSYLITIPSGLTKVGALSIHRKQQYIEHLKDIIAQAGNFKNASEVMYDEHHDAHFKRQKIDLRLNAVPALRMTSDNLCCKCKGGCCVSGKDHAYLSVYSMRRFMDENLQLASHQILNLYSSKVSENTIEGSCINQTSSGCVLPRYMRSDICNGYYCDALKVYQIKMKAINQALPVVVVQRSSTYWNRFSTGVKNDIVDVSILCETGELSCSSVNRVTK